MYIDVVESLRCPNPHEESGLVGVFAMVDGRDVVTGVLGCPVCRTEYAIREGVAWLGDDDQTAARAEGRASETEAMRLAAFLDLTEPVGFAVLHGRWAVHAPIISGLSTTHLILLDPAADMVRAPGISIVRAGAVVPLAPGSALAAAIDWPSANDGLDVTGRQRAMASSLPAVVRPGGRLLAQAAAPVPHDARELARDSEVWVAERVVPTPVIPLVRSTAGR